jgi:uncharacterized protein (TIGR00106 family)
MLAELRVTPIGKGTGIATDVASVVRVLGTTNLRYRVHSMGTTLDGSLDEILKAVRLCHETLRPTRERVLIELSIDDRDEREGALRRSLERLAEEGGRVPLERLS